ncbi:hypothetical protein N7509_013119 [Penicillium cosmopolitanum]|uniref:Endoplasmic reticulum junction formation protein lunapark n=1 Tax=Penicillium cosmopolitanum TaxID=1131564 RepID=A0A9W9SCR4_9EURO|nr:uncharacterized protein N7509_013119 [Penicillium cosmopolitanum]KAJ5376233.1 hypothetical protein N7509_013119 [Penicillium cosmopolitanum]
MVSLWPWRGEDNSPANFEKTLSTLSTKIAEATTRLDQHRSSARRFKALWTLYSTFAYLFYSIVLALVLGWESWGVKEYAAIAGGPVLIYVVRTFGSRIFDYRITRIQRRLDDYNKQRDATIEKLKVATKYNSTQQLLEKYGGESPKQFPSPNTNTNAGPGSTEKRNPPTPSQPVARTGLPPPPTANIRRAPPPGQQPLAGPPGFAPNAFPSSGQYIEQPHWYDRLLDVLLGEDEMQPRNRMAMICASCRLVNGQAPPGIKTPEELGRWRCGSCGAWNGVESETTKMLSSLRQRAPGQGSWDAGRVSNENIPGQTEEEDTVIVHNSEEDAESAKEESEEDDVKQEQEEEEEEKTEPEPVRRSKRKGGKK